MSLCDLKKYQFKECVKHALEAIKIAQTANEEGLVDTSQSEDYAEGSVINNSLLVKAHYRLSKGYVGLKDLDMAKKHLYCAAQLQPSDSTLRKEYDELCTQKKTKDQAWTK